MGANASTRAPCSSIPLVDVSVARLLAMCAPYDDRDVEFPRPSPLPSGNRREHWPDRRSGVDYVPS
jgi:hypothetical protein